MGFRNVTTAGMYKSVNYGKTLHSGVNRVRREYSTLTNMKFLICLMAVASCQAGRISRGLDYSHFPHLRTVYHGHGATSYQNVQLSNHGDVSVPTKYQNFVPDWSGYSKLDEHNDHESPSNPTIFAHGDGIQDYYTAPSTEPYAGHIEVNAIAPAPDYYEQEYEYHY